MTDLMEKLNTRGIKSAALENGWYTGEWTTYDEAGNPCRQFGWYQPIYKADGSKLINPEKNKAVLGWKNGDSKGDPHDTWANYIPGNKPLMIARRGILEPVFKGSGVLNMTEGKADTLSMWSALIYNCIGIFGASFVPDNFADLLKSWDVKMLRFFSHPDEAGRKSAQKVVNLLAGSGIEWHIYTFPLDTTGGKIDANDMWIASEFNQATFRAHLKELPELTTLTPEPVKVWTPTVKTRPEGLTNDRIHAYGQAVLRNALSNLSTVSSARNIALNEAAFKVGTWVGAGAIERGEAENELENVARSIGLGERESRRTIQSGLKAGEADPADLSKLETESKPVGRDMSSAPRIDLVTSDGAQRTERRTAPQAKREKRVSVVDWSASSMQMHGMLLGEGEASNVKPLPMPFRSVASLGGLAEMFIPGKVYAFVADSGMGKTSLIETMIDSWRRQGASGVMWGPEWSPEEYVCRAIQRQGGPSFIQMNKHIIWHQRNKAGISNSENPPTMLLSDNALSTALRILDEIYAWKGRLWFVDQPSITAAELTAAFDAACVDAESQGRPLSFAVVDYAQLLNAPGDNGAARFNAAMAEFKAFCTNPERRLIGVVGSQIGKQEGREAAHGETVDHTAMMNGRSDAFNFMMTIGRKTDPDGSLSAMASCYVAKNSVGRKGTAELYQDPTTAKWRDG